MRCRDLLHPTSRRLQTLRGLDAAVACKLEIISVKRLFTNKTALGGQLAILEDKLTKGCLCKSERGLHLPVVNKR